MNWGLIALLAGFGVVMGAASVLGFTAGIEGLLWLGIGLICVAVIVRNAPAAPFGHGFFVGLIGGGVAAGIQFLFFTQYMANNPGLAADFAEIPGGLDARTFVLLLAPLIGLASGLTLGLICWVAARLMARRRPAASSV